MDIFSREKDVRHSHLHWGLFELVAPMFFDKYVDFIDVYAEIRKDEQEAIVAAKTRAALGCGDPGMAPRYCIGYWDRFIRFDCFDIAPKIFILKAIVIMIEKKQTIPIHLLNRDG